MKKKTKVVIESAVLFTVVIVFVVINIVISKKKALAVGEYNGVNEFLKTIDCAPFFDETSESTYYIDFDLRTDVEGDVKVYLYDAEGGMYYIPNQYVSASTEFEHFRLTVTPILIETENNYAHLDFHGTYGTGVIPHVKNIVITKKE